jgi:copper chaperone CopZ
MKKTVIKVPGMWADHHVLRVRQALLGLEGVGDVVASSARRTVLVHFDEATLSEDGIRQALEAAGYPPEQPPAMIELPERHKDGSSWFVVLDRKTTTEQKDREMAGDFRRY